VTEKTEAPAEAGSEQLITFRGREIWTRLPSPEQILVWKRVLHRLQELDDTELTGEALITALDRGRRVIDTLIVNRADKDWLDDQFLDGELTFQDIAPLPTIVAEAFAAAQAAEGNRETRRAGKTTPKKATRKKA
jgi:hypothetical protein